MSGLGPAAFLLLSWTLVFITPPCTGEGSDCSCNITNSRCDDFGECRCDPGWAGDLCDLCVLMPGCVHGSCLQPWQCSCDPGWAGRFCDKDLSACSRQPCLNGATCQLEDGDVTCLCPDGFTGPSCRRRTGPCSRTRSPCRNGGLCEDADGFAAELTCRCLAGFTGRRCETDVDDCALSPCANGATCLDGANRFSCACPPGFSGRFCTVNLDDCARRPCRHGGRCLDRAGGFHCVCRPGFTGATCQEPAGRHQAAPPGPEGGGNSSLHGDEQLKVTVSERSAAGLSVLQLVLVLVLAGVTVGVVALTAALVLGDRCSGHAPSCTGHAPPADGPDAAEPQKKKLNVEV
ncbi:protein delta homolog 2 [Cololabis saira]|uniref:protein delta homolog 2 n=1 Tax=Cololabis saira TaxID=129043 RepID=UPI002AD38348|nr:protein delta homolog 2 [Cololabis saira]